MTTARPIMSAEAALALGRAAAEKKVPYFMAGVYGLVPYAVPGLKTMGVTRELVLIYDPEWTAQLSVDYCSNVLIHEAIHVYFDHCKRVEEANMERKMANIAADMSANGLMEGMGLLLPHGIYPRNFGLPNNNTLEWYYEQLTKNPDGNKKIAQLQKDLRSGAGTPGQGRSGSSSGGDGSNTGGESGGDGTASATTGGSKDKGDGKGSKRLGLGSGQCGGIAGNPIDKELEEKANKECGRSEAETKTVQKKIDAAIEKHVEVHGRGSMPAAFQEKIDRFGNKSHVLWQSKLRTIAMKMTGRMEAGGMDFSLAMPSKRSYARGMLRPGLVQLQPEIAFILDTSGSMGTKQIEDSIREVIGVMKSVGVDEAWFLEADAGVAAKPRRVRLRTLMQDLSIHGRGGTDFDPALRECMTLKPRPDLIFYMTDGDGYVTYKPPIPVVWVVVSSYYNNKPAQWGHTVFVDDKV